MLERWAKNKASSAKVLLAQTVPDNSRTEVSDGVQEKVMQVESDLITTFPRLSPIKMNPEKFRSPSVAATSCVQTGGIRWDLIYSYGHGAGIWIQQEFSRRLHFSWWNEFAIQDSPMLAYPPTDHPTPTPKAKQFKFHSCHCLYIVCLFVAWKKVVTQTLRVFCIV